MSPRPSAPRLEPPARDTFWDYREAIRRIFQGGRGDSCGAGESASEYDRPLGETPLDERLIQAVWRGQMIQTEGLRLVDGRPLRVLDAGQWNGGAGPDFGQCRLMIGEQLVSGEIEIHVDASMWRAHGHSTDIDYNGVVLHVVYRNDDGGREDMLHNGLTVPRLELEPYLFPDIDTIRRSLTPDDFSYERPGGFGQCMELMTGSDAGLIADFLDRAGDERLHSKIARLEDQLGTASPEQVFYQSIMMSLGSGPTRSLYYLLAKRVPLAEATGYLLELPPEDRRIAFEALLLQVAGLSPAQGEAPGDDSAEARAYLEKIARFQAAFEPYWGDRRMPPTKRWMRGSRPVNFPMRRLSAMALLLVRRINRGASLADDLAGRVASWRTNLRKAKPSRRTHPAVADLTSVFEVDDPSSFWADRYSFAAKPAKSSMKLLGLSTARSLVFNAVLPGLGCIAGARGDAELAEDVRNLYAMFPPLQSNHITDFMSRRLFGDDKRAKTTVNTERRRQALFQIFHSCCMTNEHDCDRCHYMTED